MPMFVFGEERNDNGRRPAADASHCLDAPAIRPLFDVPRRSAAVAAETAKVSRILVVDDELPIRVAIRRFLMRRGWAVDEAADGSEALNKLLAVGASYDAVICDLKMPRMSGRELHARLAVERPALLERFVFSTGDTVSPDAVAFLAEARCQVVEKPFELATLIRVLDRIRLATV